MKAAKLVTEAIVGKDFQTVLINSKPYTIYPPTIEKLSGAISCIADIEYSDGLTIKDILLSCGKSEQYAEALSWLIQGDGGLKEELIKGRYEEVVEALAAGFTLISVRSFQIAVSLTKNASELAAKQK